MEKKLIYRDDKIIDLYKRGYPKGIAKLQSIIDGLAGQGMTLSDNVLKDLCGGGYETKEAIKKQVDEELAKVKFQASKDEIRKQLAPLPYKVDDAAEEVRNALNAQMGGFTVSIDLDHLIVKDLKISLVPDLEEIITEQFSIYADNPAMAEAYERALKLEKEINDYLDFLREHGEYLKPVGDENMYSRDVCAIRIDKDGKAVVQPASFQALFSKRRTLNKV